VRQPGLRTTESVAQDQLTAETYRCICCSLEATIFALLADICHHHISLGEPCAMDPIFLLFAPARTGALTL
jgi:hypothetical protein